MVSSPHLFLTLEWLVSLPLSCVDTVRMETNAEKGMHASLRSAPRAARGSARRPWIAFVVDSSKPETDLVAIVPTEEPPTSDNDGGERPVRRKLRETTITSAPKNPTTDASAEGAQNDDSSRNSSRGRKRSFDEDEPEKMDAYSEASDGSGHRRKRSRDSNPEDQESGDAEKAQNADSAERKILSPKKKRSRDQVDKDEPKQAVAEQLEVKDSSEAGLSKPAEGEPEKKRHRDDSRERNAAADSKVCLRLSAIDLTDCIDHVCSPQLQMRSPTLLLFRHSAPLGLRSHPSPRRKSPPRGWRLPLLLLRRRVWLALPAQNSLLLAPLARLLHQFSRSRRKPLQQISQLLPALQLPRAPRHLLLQGLLDLRH